MGGPLPKLFKCFLMVDGCLGCMGKKIGFKEAIFKSLFVLNNNTQTFHIWNYGIYAIRNKRAQRALGRSPEEKVKGQGEAIYRGPLMVSTKYW